MTGIDVSVNLGESWQSRDFIALNHLPTYYE